MRINPPTRVLCVLTAVVLSCVAARTAPAYQLNARWSTTATDGSGLEQGDPTTLTWGLVNDGVMIEGSLTGEADSESDLIEFLNTHIGDSTVWMPLFEQSYNRWAEISGLTLLHEPNNSSLLMNNSVSSPSGSLNAVPDMRVGGHSIDGQDGPTTLAYNRSPGSGRGGDMTIDTDNVDYFSSTLNNYRRLRNTLMHEIGHGLGIAHLHSDAKFLMEPIINSSFDGPQLDDILAAQRHYGDAWEKNGGNDSAATATPLASVTNGQIASIGTDADDTIVGSTDTDFVSIDGNGDDDYYSFTIDAKSLLDITLTPKGPSYGQGPEDGTQTPFDSSAQSDLILRLYDTNGVSVLETVDESGLGDAESLTGFELDEAGTYYVRVSGAADLAQLYQLDVSTVLDLVPGDVNLDGMLSTGSGDPATDDVVAFLNGWKTVLAGDDDLTAWGKGDLNLDRVSDLKDAYLLQQALRAQGMEVEILGALTVPEPGTGALLIFSAVALVLCRGRYR